MSKKGWYRESRRHSLASRGIKTKSQQLKTPIQPIDYNSVYDTLKDTRKAGNRETSVNGFRVGNFRVKERMNQHVSRRSTGHFGTGIYYYSDTGEGTYKFIEHKNQHKSQPAYVIRDIAYNPYKIDDDKAIYLHDLGKYMVQLVHLLLNKDRYTDDKYKEHEEDIMNELGFALNRLEIYDDEARHRVLEASYNCYECLEREDSLSTNCVHPMNYFIRGMGYDGIYPTGKFGARNDFGAVVFVEDVEERLNYITNHNDDIPLEIMQRGFDIKEVN